MPSNFAHRVFGDTVLSALPDSLSERISPHLPLFQMGLHGPDLLFYYKPIRKTPLGRLGYLLHEFTGRQVIDCMRKALPALPEEQREAGLAYTLGFACHYLLDSACHPYVEQLVRAEKANHCTLEGQFDLWLIASQGQEPLETDPVSHLTGLTAEDHAVIAALFASLSRLPYPEAPLKELPREIGSAHRTMLFLNHIFASRHTVVRAMAHVGLFVTGSYEERRGMIYQKAPDPAFDGCSGQLFALLTAAAVEAPALLEAVANGRLSRRFDRNFEG